MTGALVAFVKTPGHSPIKTRLASAIGAAATEKFYQLCLASTSACLRKVKAQAGKLEVYWAVAELDCLDADIWSEFPTLYQGEGSLGSRLSSVYRKVLSQHGYACFIGADSPHMSAKLLLSNIQKAEAEHKKNFVMGESLDGGFHFFAGGLDIPEPLWTSVEYSASTTSQELSRRLKAIAPVKAVPRDFDIDTVHDLVKYVDFSADDLLPEQTELIQWVRGLSF